MEISIINRTGIEFQRVEAEFYQPKFLQAKKEAGNRSLQNFGVQVLHPAEVKRIYSENGSLQIVLAQNVRDNIMDWSVIKKMDLSIKPKIARNELKEGDVLVTRSGANYGQTSVITIEPNESSLYACADVLVLKPGEVGGPLLSTYLNTKTGKLLMKRGVYGAGQPHVAPSYISKIPFPEYLLGVKEGVENLVYQSRKLQKLSKDLYTQATQLLDEVLNFTEILTSDKTNKYQCNISDLISGRRFDSEYYSPPVVNVINSIQSLEHTQLGTNFYVKNGFPWASKKFQSHSDGEPVIRIRDIRPTYIENSKLTTLEAKYAVKVNFPKAKAGDIVIGMDGLKYFYASILEEEALVNQRVCHLTPKPNSKISSEYLTFIINSKLGQAQLLKSMTIATTVGHITNTNISKFFIPIVSEEFHDQITQMIRSSIEADKESKRLLEQAKQEVETLIEKAAQTA